MDEEDGVHRLEGTSDEKGGLIVKKKPATFKVPQTSLLGLDKLAEKKRRERADAERKRSFNTDEEGDTETESGSSGVKNVQRKYRTPQEETPTYTGGISQEARKRLIERLEMNRNKEKGVYASTKGEKKKSRDYADYNSRYRERDKRAREENRHHRHDSSRRDKTPRFRDEPRTPNISVKNEPSRTSWEDDDETAPVRRSSWDFPTPSTYKSSGGDWSERSTKSRKYDESNRSSSRDRERRKYEDSTPRPTPAHRYNAWVKDRKKSGATPGKEGVKWDATVDRELWEEEQKRLDREWYNMDEGNFYFNFFL